MSVLIFVEVAEGQIKKSSWEAIAYGAKVAEQVGGKATALVVGPAEADALSQAGALGAHQVWHANQSELAQPMSLPYSHVVLEAVKKSGAQVVVAAKSSLADATLARVAGALKAGIVGNVTSLPDLSAGFSVTRSIFTGKAFAQVAITSDVKILTLKKNTLEAELGSNQAEVSSFEVSLGAETLVGKITETVKASGAVSLPEADIVVSGGRGMKGPEHWQPLLDLADALGAATACSKPVSDADWRPHHEHVGQTGVKVAPNLYIACGISGAIQHLAGVNSSKVLVVINKDPEAPFFKAADYGIVGDVFEILPKLTAAVKGL
ncbi:MAG: electron transfer flavoprotein subunit alpha/FixB family protein [Spirosomataceae bacterium]